MVILGLNAYHADSAACLIVDGRLVAAAEEERFRRVKHWAGLPTKAIEYCLSEARLNLSEVEHIAINRNPGVNNWRRLGFVVTHWPSPSLMIQKVKNIRSAVSAKETLEHVYKMELKAEVHQVEHHLAHLASAFLVSDFQEAACLSVDGFGDFASTAFGFGLGHKITIDQRIYFPHSLGIFYSALTQYLGFPHYGDEYKVMGLAPYGEPKMIEALREVVSIQTDGTFRLNLDYFRHHTDNVSYTWEDCTPSVGLLYKSALIDLLGPARAPNEPLEQKHKDLARSIQVTYEKAFFSLLHTLHKQHPCDNLALAGGCAMNSVANGKIYRRTPFTQMYIPAAAGDAGGAIGAAAVVLAELDDSAVFAPAERRRTAELRPGGATVSKVRAAITDEEPAVEQEEEGDPFAPWGTAGARPGAGEEGKLSIPTTTEAVHPQALDPKDNRGRRLAGSHLSAGALAKAEPRSQSGPSTGRLSTPKTAGAVHRQTFNEGNGGTRSAEGELKTETLRAAVTDGQQRPGFQTLKEDDTAVASDATIDAPQSEVAELPAPSSPPLPSPISELPAPSSQLSTPNEEVPPSPDSGAASSNHASDVDEDAAVAVAPVAEETLKEDQSDGGTRAVVSESEAEPEGDAADTRPTQDAAARQAAATTEEESKRSTLNSQLSTPNEEVPSSPDSGAASSNQAPELRAGDKEEGQEGSKLSTLNAQLSTPNEEVPPSADSGAASSNHASDVDEDAAVAVAPVAEETLKEDQSDGGTREARPEHVERVVSESEAEPKGDAADTRPTQDATARQAAATAEEESKRSTLNSQLSTPNEEVPPSPDSRAASSNQEPDVDENTAAAPATRRVDDAGRAADAPVVDEAPKADHTAVLSDATIDALQSEIAPQSAIPARNATHSVAGGPNPQSVIAPPELPASPDSAIRLPISEIPTPQSELTPPEPPPVPQSAIPARNATHSVAGGRIPQSEIPLPHLPSPIGELLAVPIPIPSVPLRPLHTAYLGPESTQQEIHALLDWKKQEIGYAGCIATFLSEEELNIRTAQAIADGKVIGWFQGRMEWGPRALGNRSILADPRRADMKDILNAKIKRRESFRPFAPSILREAVSDWFEQEDDVPFMMEVFQIRPQKRSFIPAVTHVDGSGRLQTVHRETNPHYYRLIEKFRDLTGIPMVLNTSFNENEPVVCYPEEALDCFLRTKMDLLVLGNFCIERKA